MSLPNTPTLVTFPQGMVTGHSQISFVRRDHDHCAVVTRETPVHPVDAVWPDQGPDRGAVLLGTQWVPILDCVVGATNGIELFLGTDIPVRKGEPGWVWVVVHLLPATCRATPGDDIYFKVDAPYRLALSFGHTSCHLAALAMNRAFTSLWRKEVPRDPLGSPDFDWVARGTSQVLEYGSLDRYRIGRSVRRKGFLRDDLVAGLAEFSETINADLATWIARGGPVSIAAEGPHLTDLRTWQVVLDPEGEAIMPCGGTHVSRLEDFAELRVNYQLVEEPGALVLEMRTHATPTPGLAASVGQ